MSAHCVAPGAQAKTLRGLSRSPGAGRRACRSCDSPEVLLHRFVVAGRTQERGTVIKDRVDEVERAKNRTKAKVRSKVEHVFAVLKLKFGASLPRSRCGGSLYLLSCIKPLDAFTSGAERLQSELVQTFPKVKCHTPGPTGKGAPRARRGYNHPERSGG